VQDRWYPLTKYRVENFYATFRYGPDGERQWFDFRLAPSAYGMKMDANGNLAIAGYYGGTDIYIEYIPASTQLVEGSWGRLELHYGVPTYELSESPSFITLDDMGRLQDMEFDGSGNLLLLHTFAPPERSDYHRARISSMAPDGTVTTLWEGFPDGSTESRPGSPSSLDVGFGLAVAEDGTLFVSDPYQHAIYQISPSTGQSTLVAGRPGEAGDSD
jgi:hypothetical protein